MKNQTIKLCCGRKGGCPAVDFQEEKLVITDDFGGKVQLTYEELEDFLGQLGELAEAVENGDVKEECCGSCDCKK